MKAKKLFVGLLATAIAVNTTGLPIAAENGNDTNSGYNDSVKVAVFDPSTGLYVYEDGSAMKPIRSNIQNNAVGDDCFSY